MKTLRTLVLLGSVLGLAACSSSRMAQVEPRMNLRDYGTVGLVKFASNTDDQVAARTSQEFLTAIQAAQPGVPVLELGDNRYVGAARTGTQDPATVRALGAKHEVDVILFGVLEAKEVRPKVSIGGDLESLKASAEIEGLLNAKLYDVRTGATIWSTSARDRQTVAGLSVSGGGLSGAGVSHPDESRDRMVHNLVDRATTDFRPTWIRVKDE
jgi:hypothetical protein